MRSEWIEDAEKFLTQQEEREGQEFFDRSAVLAVMVGYACKKIAEGWLARLIDGAPQP